MRKLFFLTIILILAAEPSFAKSMPKREVKKGNILYNKGEYNKALERYNDAFKKAPDSEVVNFNLGSALYKTGDYESSLMHFEKSLVSDEKSLEERASYNIGNAKYKYAMSKEKSDLPAAVGLLKQSLRHYRHALEIEPEDKDAEYNYEFVKKELKRLEEKLKKKKEEEKTRAQQKKDKREEGSKGQEGRAQEDREGKKGQQPKKEESENKGKEEQKGAQQKEEGQGMNSASKEREKEEVSRQMGNSEAPQGEMSEKEAQMLLRNYSEEEEPKGLYREKIPVRNLPDVLRDW